MHASTNVFLLRLHFCMEVGCTLARFPEQHLLPPYLDLLFEGGLGGAFPPGCGWGCLIGFPQAATPTTSGSYVPRKRLYIDGGTDSP